MLSTPVCCSGSLPGQLDKVAKMAQLNVRSCWIIFAVNYKLIYAFRPSENGKDESWIFLHDHFWSVAEEIYVPMRWRPSGLVNSAAYQFQPSINSSFNYIIETVTMVAATRTLRRNPFCDRKAQKSIKFPFLVSNKRPTFRQNQPKFLALILIDHHSNYLFY